MDRQQHAALTSFELIQRFLDANATAIGEVASTSGAKVRLDSAVGTLTSLAATQGTSASLSKDARAKQLKARRELLQEHMQAIAAVARADLAGAPDASSLKAPSVSIRTKSLLDAAESMAQVAGKTPQVFVTAGLPADFVDQLRSAAAAVQQFVASGEDSRKQRTAASLAIVEAVKTGHAAVRILNPLVKTALKGNTLLLAQWKGRKKTATAAAQQVIASAPAPTSAPASSSAPAAPVSATAAPSAPAGSGGTAGNASGAAPAA